MEDKQSEISVMTTMSEPFILEEITMREVSLEKTGSSKRLYIKLQGKNNKSEQIDQIKIHLSKYDAEQLALGINEAIKKGLFTND